MQKKLTNHAVSLKGVVNTCRKHGTTSPNETAFYKPFKNVIEITKNVVGFKRRSYSQIKRFIQPGFLRLAKFLEDEYLPACRTNIAVTSLPEIGEEFYKGCLKFHTSTDLTAEEIHIIGLKEVARIEDGMKEIVRELGLKLSLKEFKEKLKSDNGTFFGSAQEVLDTVSNLVYDRIEPNLSKIFHQIPKALLDIKKSPSPHYPPAIYLAGTEDGSQPGQLFINNHNFDTLPKHLMLGLVLHEVYPGHHLQQSYMLEKKTLPKFRRVMEDRKMSQAPSIFSMNTVFTEGWGMYSEALGHDLGLYEDPIYIYMGSLAERYFVHVAWWLTLVYMPRGGA